MSTLCPNFMSIFIIKKHIFIIRKIKTKPPSCKGGTVNSLTYLYVKMYNSLYITGNQTV